MKKVYLFFTLLLLCVASLFAQAPEKFTYQAVVRNASNQLVANANVGVRVSVLQGAANGTPMYVETHTVTTNGNGLLTLEIGGGTTLQGSVAGIDWGSGLYFLKTEVDPAGGTNYSVTSTQQMLSVPYALYAAAAGNVPAIAVTPTDTGYVLVLTPAEGTPQTYILRNGVDGAQGPQGPSGPEGPQGPVGPAGSQGPVGPQGPAGADGNDGAPGAQGLPGNDGAPGAPGADGRGILAITGPVTDGLQDTYTILYTDSTVSTFTVTNGTPGEQGSAGPEGPQGPAGADGNDGAPGAQGLPGNDGAPGTDGRGILAITGPVTDGLQDTYTILYTDSTVSTFTVTNGAPGQPGNDGEPGAQGLPGNDGAPGADGRGILSFTGPVSDGNVDTYTILYTDSTTSILTVTNGVDGVGVPQTLSLNGDQLTISGGNTVTIPINSGAPGTDGRGIQYISGPETDGLVDTYTIHYTDSTTSAFTVTNGAPGNDGAPGLPGNDGEPGAQGLPGNDGAPGADGRGIVTITGPVTNGLQDTYTILYTDSTVSTFTVTNGTPGNDGAPGTPGEDGFSPVVTTNTVSGVGTYVTITDTNGPHTFLIPDNSTSGDTFTQLPANWMEADSTNPQFIMNKPTIPTVPAAVSAFDNDMGYLTGADLTPVQSQIDSLQGQLDSLTNMMNSISEQMEEDNFQCGTSTVKDFDGNVYNTVEIGGQCWMRENLRVTHLKDGTEIPLGDDPTATLRRYYPHNIQMNSTVLKHGWLYPWTTVMDGAAASTNMPSGVQGICPDGWHVPSYAEWTELTNYVNSQSEYLCNGEDGYIAKALADNNTAWPAHPAACVAGNDYSANNATGFSAVAPGEVLINGSYLDYSFTGYYWSTSRSGDNGEFVKVFTLSYGLPGVNYQNKTENYCLSVRCLRDYEPAEAQLNLHDSLAVVAFTGNYNDLTNTPTLAAVATSGNYNDLADKPEIGEGVLTIQINGTDQGTFNANQTDTTVVNISVPSMEEINAMVTSALGDLNDRITALEQSVNGLSAIIANADITLTVPDNGVQEYTLPETLTQFTIVDNGGNGNYHGNTNGSLKLTAPAGKVFKISLEEMATEDNYDILKIYNGLTTTSSATILNISGTDSVPMVFHTPSNQMLVNFHSDFSTELLGFLMNVQVVDKAMACGEDKFMVDVEGNLYSTVQLGDQCWMRENLRTAHYANDLDNMSEYEIPLGSEASDTLPYCFFPNNDSLNLMQYGYLYNWAAVMHGEAPSNDNPSGVQGICPTGWHVPSKAEMQQLRYYVGGQSQFVCGDGYNIAQALASTVGWDSTTNPCAPGYDMASNNATGFSAMPTGVYRSQYDFYAEFGSATAFWNSYLEGDYAGNCSIVYRLGTINIALTPRINGNPIRCLRD